MNDAEGVEYWKKNAKLVKEVQDIFAGYNVYPNPITKDMQKKIKRLEERCTKAGMRFVHTELARVGTDRLVELITSFRDDLKSKGVEFVGKADVTGIKKTGQRIICSPDRNSCISLRQDDDCTGKGRGKMA